MILNEKEICQYLGIPSIPKKKWDGKKPFRSGVAITELRNGMGEAYAVATFDTDRDNKPRIKKVFSMLPYDKVVEIFIVPDYMNENVDDMDFTDDDKKKAQWLIDEANEIVAGHDGEQEVVAENKNPYLFDHIHNDDEARAYIAAYNKANRIKGRVPASHEALLMRLSVIYSGLNNENKKKIKK